MRDQNNNNNTFTKQDKEKIFYFFFVVLILMVILLSIFLIHACTLQHNTDNNDNVTITAANFNLQHIT